VLEILSRARFINTSQATFAGYTMAALLFVLITIPLTRVVDVLQRRDQARQRA
jgi:ABC-type amino acid transport system permease subunit